MHHKPITVTVTKAQFEPSGLFLYKDENNRILINGIFNGVFQNTELKPLMEILSVNGISCEGMTDDFVVSLIDEAEGQVNVVARGVTYEAFVAHPVEQPVSTVSNTSNTTTVPSQQQSLLGNERNAYPPPGCSAGGEWKQSRYPGTNTAVLCLILACVFGPYSLCGLSAYLCPQDVMDVYVHQGKVC